MIRFRTKPKAVWVRGDHPMLDASELAPYTKAEREQLEFLVEPMTPALVRELREKHTRLRLGTMGETIGKEVDEDAYQQDLIDHIVKDWKGIADEDGNPLACTRENKLKLFDYGYPLLGACLVRMAQQLMSRMEEFDLKHREEEEKNLDSSQSGLAEDNGKSERA